MWANSPWFDSYFDLWQTKLKIGLGSFVLDKPLILWINDGLMAMFFFFVGLEIKREILVGELSSPRQAALPIVAALGGMIVPAILYLVLNAGKPGASGWGIPMATDIAFTLGVLALLGKRVPIALKVFLTSVAIVDDIGAVLVIAFFYTSQIYWSNLIVGAGFLIALILANRAGIRHPLVYASLGIGGLWLAFLMSGVHATIAGVLSAMTIPASTRIGREEFLEKSRYILKEFEGASVNEKSVLTSRQQRRAAEALEKASELVQTPLQRLEHDLHPWVIFGIMPLFALANAGVSLDGNLTQVLINPVTLGIVFGLVFGKQIGITLFSWLAVRSGIATLPVGVNWWQVYGVGWLAGIGFTMSLFIAGLAFRDIALLSLAKLGILTASLIAGVVGWIILRKGRF
ncbi:MAG: Na+/H+ antiporter NhaA, Na+:H+ antiporter, NhaA family [Candidatus Dadabacteria bacterium CSP1-2]|nr:MAG: Na+/H+ antiporter NhaA, Na+:H+ antiporter, NhaA family [Candidatus Dadabacteria bacterium CSP1-2]